MQTILRKATPEDAPAMARLLVLAWQKAYRGILSDALLAGRDADAGGERIRAGIETRPEFWYFVLEADGNIAGVSVVVPCRDADLPEAREIQVFYIHPDVQGQGLGRIMMKHTLAAIPASGGPRAVLWVLRDNHGARAFYERVGFQADGAAKTLENLENAATVRYRYTERE